MSRNELYHYGVLGQRWGIRRYQNKDGTLTAAGKKKYSSQVKFQKAYKALDKKKYANRDSWKTRDYINSDKNKMRTNEILLPKDLSLTRISTNSDESKAKALYVNFVKDLKEVDYYKKQWPYEVDSITGKANDWYENTFNLKADIRTPSLERRKEAANAVINADEKMKIELGKQYVLSRLARDNVYIENYIPKPYSNSFDGVKKYYRDYRNKLPDNRRRVSKQLQKEASMSIEEAIKDYETRKKAKFDAIANPNDFQAFTASIPRSKKLMSAYINELKKDGFDAVFDDNAGAKAAFIIFDAKNVDQVKSEKFDVDYSHMKNDEYLDMSPWVKEKLKSAT